MDYYIENDKLIMIYEPFNDSFNFKLKKQIYEKDSITISKNVPLYEYLNNVEFIRLKNTFYIRKDNLIKYDENGVYYICIGKVVNNYILLDKDVFNINIDFYFSINISIIDKLFYAYSKISIIQNINHITNNSVYIDDDKNLIEEPNHISYSKYLSLIKSFPNTSEIFKYRNKRITLLLNDCFDNTEKFIQDYDKYIEKKRKNKQIIIIPNKTKLNNLIKAKSFLETIINNNDAMSEKEIQSNIYEILSFLFPKYIYSKREVKISGFDKHYKRPDFLLVDFSGFVDVLEIKLPSAKLLSKGMNRFNYVPSHEFSKAVQQIQKYIVCLNRNGKNGDEKLANDLKNIIPTNLIINSINSQGILIIGNTNEFTNEQQKIDFEIIKRQYKNIIDIYTYDQLLSMINNSINSIKQ